MFAARCEEVLRSDWQPELISIARVTSSRLPVRVLCKVKSLEADPTLDLT